MSQRLGWWLFTDPAFEQAFESFKAKGFAVNVVARDSFEETVKSGLFEVERSARTWLGTAFDTAVDWKTRDMLVTADVPATEKGEMPPPMKIVELTFNGMRFGLPGPVGLVDAGRVLSSLRVEQRAFDREEFQRAKEAQKALRKKQLRYVR